MSQKTTQNITQAGDENVALQGVTGSTVSVEVVIKQSVEYTKLRDSLAEAKANLAKAENAEPADPERIAKMRARLEEKKKQIADFEDGIIRIAATFSRIKINTVRLRRAYGHFDKGEYNEARAVLESELAEMEREHDELLANKEKYDADIAPKLTNNAGEFHVLAQTTVLQPASAGTFEEARQYFVLSTLAAPGIFNLLDFGDFLAARSYPRAALRLYTQVRETLWNELSGYGQVLILNRIGNICSELLRYAEAEKNLARAVSIQRGLVDNDAGENAGEKDLPGFLHGLGSLYTNMKRYKDGETYLLEALSLVRKFDAEEIGMRALAGFILHSLAFLELSRKGPDAAEKAEKYVDEAVGLRRAIAASDPEKSSDELAFSLTLKAMVQSGRKQHEAAIAGAQEALEIARKIAAADPLSYNNLVCAVGHELGKVLRAAGRLPESAEVLERSARLRDELTAYDRLPSAAQAADTLQELAITYREMKDDRLTVHWFDESIRFWRMAGECDAEDGYHSYEKFMAVTLSRMASFYYEDKRDLRMARTFAGEAVSILSRYEDDPDTELKKYLDDAKKIIAEEQKEKGQ